MPAPREPNSPPPRGGRKRQDAMPGGWLWLLVLLLLFFVLYLTLSSPAGNIYYSEFMSLAEQGKFDKVVLRGDRKAVGEFKKGEVDKLDEATKQQVRGDKVETNVPDKPKMIDDLKKIAEKQKNFKYTIEEEPGGWVGPLLMMILPAVILLAIFFFFLLP